LFFKKTGVSQPRSSFNPFCDFSLIARSGTIVRINDVIGLIADTRLRLPTEILLKGMQ